MTQIPINEADLYFLAPLKILNYPDFEKNLLSAGWVRPSEIGIELYANDALYESEAAFLGILKNGESPLRMNGTCFVAPEQPKTGSLLKFFYDTFKKNKKTGKPLAFETKKAEHGNNGIDNEENLPEWLNNLTIGNIMRIHVSPDKEIALFLLHFRLAMQKDASMRQSIQQVESTSYLLHKTDKQAPAILLEGHSIPGFETVMDIVISLTNSPSNVIEPYRPGRLLTATYLQTVAINSDPNVDSLDYSNTLKDYVAHIGLSKNRKYSISEEDKKKVVDLFSDITVFASPEGFCGAFQDIEGANNQDFMEKSSTTFLKSYLPIYIETVMVELISVHMLDSKQRRNLSEQSELFRELKLMGVMPVSRYYHLVQLKHLISEALSINPKIETVSGYLDTLRGQKEQKQESNINLLLGFMGVGQVVFAILDLSRTALDTDRTIWQVAASALSAIFGLLALFIIFIVVRSYFKKH